MEINELRAQIEELKAQASLYKKERTQVFSRIDKIQTEIFRAEDDALFVHLSKTEELEQLWNQYREINEKYEKSIFQLHKKEKQLENELFLIRFKEFHKGSTSNPKN